MVVAVAVVLALVVAGDTTLDRCRAESQALNTGKAIATCQAAANEAQLKKPEKVEALKLLGMALMVESETDLAEDAFKKMLTLDDTATLGADAGPNVQKVFERAKEQVRDEKAKAAAAPSSSSSSSSSSSAANTAPPSHEPGGAVLPPAIPWSLIGVGAGVAVASSVLAGGAIYDRYYNRVPCGAARNACIPFAPMLFGIYQADDREKFRTDAGAWIGGGITVAVVGALAAGAGGALLALAPAPDATTTPTTPTTTPTTTTPPTTTPAPN